jgi:hypothetical protein
MSPEAVPAALNAQIAAMVSGFSGEVYPSFVFLRDADGDFALFRMQQPNAEVELLGGSGRLGWPLALTLVAASGHNKSVNIASRRCGAGRFADPHPV